ncbi:hypothetical protein ABZ759_11110 [Streptomyces sp. NPDC047860]|uniref:hypothetical protein n=1 Tax=Streptomyces sp. NPDC047860 TaxID=3155743 RepID=UPI0033C888C4
MTVLGATVGIVGTGAVGQAVGSALVTAGLCGRRRRAEGRPQVDQVVRQGRGLFGRPPCEEERHCAAVVVTVRASFYNARSTDVRMGGAQANTPVVRALAEQLAGYPGTVLMVTNPVDLMTRLFAETSGCTRVFGIGSSLDTARYRLTLARLLNVPLRAVRPARRRTRPRRPARRRSGGVRLIDHRQRASGVRTSSEGS